MSKKKNSEKPVSMAPMQGQVLIQRMFTHGTIASGLVVFSLVIGIAGYMGFEHLRPVDAFLNACMILGGMGPVDPMKTEGGKIFAGFYALYSGLIFLVVAGLILAPVIHKVLHRFHLEIAEQENQE